MMYAHFLASILTAMALSPVIGAVKTYTLQDWHQGSAFLNGWSFFTGPDPTHGNVNYLSEEDATAQGLAYVDEGNHVVLAVDSQSYVPPGGNRNSVRITSNKAYSSGLFILDAVQMPVGCAVWGSFWTVNGPHWPAGGEIDVVEGVNKQVNNQMTLHSGTSYQCTLGGGAFTGHALASRCYSSQASNSGCSIIDVNPRSYGYGFNSGQGGVFALLWDPSNGISIWFFPREDVPKDISYQVPDPRNWGEPAGFWSAESCDIADNFYDHTMVLDTTICGDWAGSAYPSSGCPGTCSNIVANASNFVDAKWRIRYVAVYN